MNNPHFFKAKAIRRDNGQWVYGYFVEYGSIIITTSMHGKVVPYVSELISHFVYPETVCYFTGILDKNAQEIWSNDTAQWDYDGRQYRVEYLNAEFRLRFGETNIKDLYFDEVDYGKEIQRTGNIFDNYKPENHENIHL